MDFNLVGFSWILGGFMCFYGRYTKYGSSTVGFYGSGILLQLIISQTTIIYGM